MFSQINTTMATYTHNYAPVRLIQRSYFDILTRKLKKIKEIEIEGVLAIEIKNKIPGLSSTMMLI